MDRLQAMETFVRVMEAGSFRKAADTLHVLPSTVTRTIKELEAYLGTRLLHRTTRALSATDAGLRYYDRCKVLLHDLQEAEAQAAQAGAALRGALKIGATASLAKHCLLPAMTTFTQRYPHIHLELRLSDAPVDIVQQGIDCVIRTGALQSSQLVARRVGGFHWVLCAAPEYLERHGTPKTVAELKDHLAVGYTGGQAGHYGQWRFIQAPEPLAPQMRPVIDLDDTEAYLAAGLAGLGIIRIASYMAQEHLAAGRLVRLLADIATPPEPISILYPHSRHLSPLARAFIDWSSDLLTQASMDW